MLGWKMPQDDKSYWVKNTTLNDLVFSELEIRIPSAAEVDLFTLNPTLSKRRVLESAASGSLQKCFELKKLIKLVNSSKNPYQTYGTVLKESVKPIPSRVKTSIIVDIHEHDHIEELSGSYKESDQSKFVDYSEGFSDPIQDELALINTKDRENEDIVYIESEKQAVSNDKYLPIRNLIKKKR